ncbi:MAG: EVE domain-containing protein [Deltaproteobacteria bacterium]|nr:MAG: EVE domain-containing protein [Deltaproteobacteria bacterium]
MSYWLLKTEPSSYSIDDLLRDGKAGWSGVRNYQARNFLRDGMKKGDRALIYHSSAEPTAVVGEAEVVREGHPDPTQFDRKDDHYDPDSPADEPRWFQVELKALRKFPHPVTLAEIKAEPDLREMLLIRRGMRLSVQPVTKEQYQAIVRMAR